LGKAAGRNICRYRTTICPYCIERDLR